MSVAGISSSSMFDYNTQSVQTQMQKFKQEFQQLGQDLQSGNLSAAKTDFAALEKSAPQGNSSAGANSIVQEFKQLSTDLQSGNTSAAQQDYSTIQNNFQNMSAQHHRHHHVGGGSSGSSSESQTIDQLGQDLQSGNLSAAQQAYAALQQEFQQFGSNSASLASQDLLAQSTSGGVSLTA
jgi:outer membrane protein assembly factor BamD (BamD/ComL family)